MIFVIIHPSVFENWVKIGPKTNILAFIGLFVEGQGHKIIGLKPPTLSTHTTKLKGLRQIFFSYHM